MIFKNYKIKYSVRWLFSGCFFLFLLFFILLLFFSSPPGESILKHFVENQIEKILNQKIQIHYFETNILSRIQLCDVVIYPEEIGVTNPFIYLNHIKLDYKLVSLLRHGPTVESLELDSLNVFIRRDKTGKLNIPILNTSQKVNPDSTSKSVYIQLNQISIQHSSIHYNDKTEPLNLFIKNLYLAVQHQKDGHYDYFIHSDSIGSEYHDFTFTGDKFKLGGFWNSWKWRIDSVLIFIAGQEITGNGEIRKKGEIYCDFNLKGRTNFLPQSVLTYIPQPLSPLRSKLDIKLHLEGFLNHPKANVQMNLQEIEIAEHRNQSALISILWEPGIFTLKKMRLELLNGVVSGNGFMVSDTLVKGLLSLKADRIDLSKLWRIIYQENSPYEGLVKANVSISGYGKKLKKWKSSAGLELYNMKYKSRSIPDLNSSLAIYNGTAHFQFNHRNSSFIADVKFDQTCLNGKYSAEITELEPLSRFFNIRDLTGNLKARGNIAGKLNSLNIIADIIGTKILYQNFPLDTLDATIIFKDNKLILENSTFNGQCVTIDTLHPPLNLFSIRNGFSYQGYIKGPLNNPEGEITAKFFKNTLKEIRFDSGNIWVTLRDQKVLLNSLRFQKDSLIADLTGDFHFGLKSGNFQCEFFKVPYNSNKKSENIFSNGFDSISRIPDYSGFGRLYAILNIEDSKHWSGEIQGSDIDLFFLNYFSNSGAHISGRSSCQLKWRGTIRRPLVKGSLKILDGKIQLKPNAIPIDSIQFDALFQDSLLQIETRGQMHETPFKLKCQATTSHWKESHIKIAFSVSDNNVLKVGGLVAKDSLFINSDIENFNLSLLHNILSHVDQFNGNVNSQLTITGSIRHPKITGIINICDLQFQPNYLNKPLTKGVLRINFDHNRMNIDSLFLRYNQGSLFATGNLAYDKKRITHINLTMDMNNIEINRPKEFILIIHSGRLSYKKLDTYYELNGDIIMDETRLLYNFQPKVLLSLIKSTEKPSKDASPVLQQTRLNVRLRESEKIWADNNLAKLRFHSELDFKGTLLKPNITGRLSVKEGYILYLDRKFKVKQGILDFVNPDRINPIVDLKAEANIKSYQTITRTPYIVVLTIKGPLDQAVFELTSDPSLEKSDIIALLTVGATRNQLVSKDANAKEPYITEILKERAAQLSSQRISGFASRKVGSLLGLQEITIDGNLFRVGKTWGPQLLASKKLSERMEITYTTTVGHSNEQNIRLDYRLSKYFSFEGQTDQQGRSGIDLKYQLKFK